MNPIQKKLLELADTINLGEETAYALAKRLEVDHPFKVKYAIDQLIRNGYLIRDNNKSVRKAVLQDHIAGLVSIPYYGEVNCGEALVIADDTIKSYLRISPSVIHISNTLNLFALKACGNSMNRANIHHKAVDDGDYIIAEKRDAHHIHDGEYVISLIGGAANLKRFHKDRINRRIVLFSESTIDLPPIIISEQDADEVTEYQPIARVVDIIKGVPAF
jgi:SOS-response transcriptional repressor LexA